MNPEARVRAHAALPARGVSTSRKGTDEMATAPALQVMRDTHVAPPAHLVDLKGRDRDWVLGLFALA